MTGWNMSWPSIAVGLKLNRSGGERTEDPSRAPATDCFRLAANLLGNDGLALFLPYGNRLIENSNDLREALVSTNPKENMAKMGIFHWLARPTATEDPIDLKRNREFQKSLKRFIEAFQAGPPGESFEITVVVRSQSAAELLTVRVEGVKRTSYRGYQLTGFLNEPSELIPRLVVGEPVSIGQFDVVKWSFSNGDRIERASLWE